MATKIVGGCQCGEVRYEIDGEQIMTDHCHCRDCQKSSGSGHATVVAFPEAAVKITGELKSYVSRANSGGLATRTFCPTCGGRISYKTSNWPGHVLIAAGSLDNPSMAKPGVIFFSSLRPEWDLMDTSLTSHAAMPQKDL